VEILSTPTSASYGLDLSASSSSQSLTESNSSGHLTLNQEPSINLNTRLVNKEQ